MTKTTQAKVRKMAAEYVSVNYARLARIKELEQGVVGSMRNPSDSDQFDGRIGWGDVCDAKGCVAAEEWSKLNNSNAYYKYYDKLKGNSRTLFFNLTHGENVPFN